MSLMKSVANFFSRTKLIKGQFPIDFCKFQHFVLFTCPNQSSNIQHSLAEPNFYLSQTTGLLLISSPDIRRLFSPNKCGFFIISGRLTRNRNWLPFASTQVHLHSFGGVCVDHLISFLCCVGFICSSSFCVITVVYQFHGYTNGICDCLRKLWIHFVHS